MWHVKICEYCSSYAEAALVGAYYPLYRHGYSNNVWLQVRNDLRLPWQMAVGYELLEVLTSTAMSLFPNGVKVHSGGLCRNETGVGRDAGSVEAHLMPRALGRVFNLHDP